MPLSRLSKTLILSVFDNLSETVQTLPAGCRISSPPQAVHAFSFSPQAGRRWRNAPDEGLALRMLHALATVRIKPHEKGAPHPPSATLSPRCGERGEVTDTRCVFFPSPRKRCVLFPSPRKRGEGGATRRMRGRRYACSAHLQPRASSRTRKAPLTRPSATLSPRCGERDEVTDARCVFFPSPRKRGEGCRDQRRTVWTKGRRSARSMRSAYVPQRMLHLGS